MEPIEFETKYSLPEYFDIIAERASRAFAAKRAKPGATTQRYGWFLGAVVLMVGGIWALQNGLPGTATLTIVMAFAAGLNWAVTTEYGHAFVVPLIVCALAICLRKLKPTYRFRIDDSGIRRSVGSEDFSASWSDVVRVENYAHAFMIELKQGAMPILYRSVPGDQRKRLEQAFQTYAPA